MVTEIAGAKILTPFFGASLYSWASTLSITLCALMTGYYFGGYVTTRPRFSSSDRIIWVRPSGSVNIAVDSRQEHP